MRTLSVLRSAGLAAVTAMALSTAASAQSVQDGNYETGNYVAPAAGVVVGTVAGVGLYNGWWGSGATATSLGATTASSIAAGGVIGVGTIALVDAVLQPCRGFHAMFDLSRGECVNGQWVGYRDGPRGMRYSRR